MELKSFQITNFRSINDSGPVSVGKLTSLVGRNESGKSNLLLGLKTLTPAGGAQRVSYMVALLTSERLRVIVLLDEERQSRSTRDELVKSKLIRDDGIIFVSAGFTSDARPTDADIEDLIEPDIFDALARESYKVELKGKELIPNASVPRIVKRYEMAFEALGLEFNKTRVARLFLSKMAKEPLKMMPDAAIARFEALFAQIGQAHAKVAAKVSPPFH